MMKVGNVLLNDALNILFVYMASDNHIAREETRNCHYKGHSMNE